MSRSKAVVVGLLLIAVAIGFLFLPVREWFGMVAGHVEALGPAGPIVFAVAYAALAVLLVPGSALTIGAGTLFGLWVGLAVVVVGANGGALASFLLARTLLREKVAVWAAANPRFAALDRAIGREGFKMVLLSRLSPVFPFTLLNYLLGLTRVRTGSYALANVLGMLPGTFLYVYIGATAREALGGGDGGPYRTALTVVGLVATVAVVALVTRAARRAMAEVEVEPAAPDAGAAEVAP